MLHSFAPPSVLPDISPTWGEIGRRRCFRQSPTSQEEAPTAKLPISPQVGEMSGRTEGGAKDHSLPDCRPSATRPGCSR
ncbi:hypothetical protein EOC93_01245 [Mesorhizobium sp. M6A.T.Ce.TU.002.03.1.1]|uniref:Propionyl-coenzyme A carboxylase alpha polypeptide n=1 Tax=Mesorhizobium mediterraneum TaxID=43617 RepID=A0AB36RET0_9HYPH|nr:hypothetical protein EJ075_03925 [Mesorhizobium sp. M6A.T.Cr.TU.016.01.1.1]PAQ03118.1 hypothetical protein CIT25_06885 [Mesorhizobium mediterraneum]RUU47083.1 hypothetical protein EOC93_01245 [Mesorhizobium sp. M6A.T.Ce.TU.002.03.1.1]RUV04537.1 hypothetical protein EOB36_02045 [Mesorhizobium sp. M6A.T.Cr.TU.017.01.1.1]RVB78589.1 hypothetical protein EN885_08370 [Mesorhizobium sp. M6A.T.Cr.TU.014.01.1.1]RWN45030.1 MAG: hypothetical protein EOR96_01495 [Mesorhizobium sp.]